MFNLKKILNSDTTSPDTTYMLASNEGFTYGSFVKAGSDGILYNIEDRERPTHVCCENLAKGISKRIRCFPITDDMVFSAPSSSIMTEILPGTKLALIKENSDRVNMVIEDTVEGNLYVYDTCGAKEDGDTILIRFAQ
ncbi:MAG: hypothetical protein IKJ13_00720 [Clostridia bacterium]|nr:hypothetical protein [Clostridia bacterium]MBR3805347.1 hypothetical protein [Clostridia bacterium]